MQVDIAENSQPKFLSSFNLEGAEQRSFSQTTMTADIKILDTLESKVQSRRFFQHRSQQSGPIFHSQTKVESIILHERPGCTS